MVLLQLSQTHLTVLEQCPRKFQYIYVDQLVTPISPDQRVLMEKGNFIHYLMHQRELKIPFDLAFDPSCAWESEKNAESTVQGADSNIAALCAVAMALSRAIPIIEDVTFFRQSEYRLNLEMSGVLLTVVYDLVILNDRHAYIFDWKTYSQPPKREHLNHAWQTKLYPFVLTETSDYLPSQVHLSYWFVHNKSDEEIITNPIQLKPEHIAFHYSDRLHQQTRGSLQQMIEQVKVGLDRYPQETAFPKTEKIETQCRTCSFALRCDRLQQAQAQWESLSDITAIHEIPLE